MDCNIWIHPKLRMIQREKLRLIHLPSMKKQQLVINKHIKTMLKI